MNLNCDFQSAHDLRVLRTDSTVGSLERPVWIKHLEKNREHRLRRDEQIALGSLATESSSTD